MKCPKVVWNSMSRVQQMKVRKMKEQQCIRPAFKQPSAEARIAVIEAQFRVISQSKEEDVMMKEGDVRDGVLTSNIQCAH